MRDFFINFKAMSGVLAFRRPSFYLCVIANELVGMIPQLGLGIIYMEILNAIVARDKEILIGAVIKMVAGILVFCILSPTFDYLSVKIIRTNEMNLKSDMYQKIVNLPEAVFHNIKSSDYFTRLINDTDNLLKFYDTWVPNVVNCVFYCAGSILLMIYLDWRMALITIGCSFVIFLVNKNKGGWVRKYEKQAKQIFSDMIHVFTELFDHLEICKFFRLKKVLMERYQDLNTSYVKLAVGIGWKKAFVSFINSSLVDIFGYMVYILGAIFVFLNQLTFGKLVALAQYQNGVTSFFAAVS